jgi:3-hydroxyacyl-[acyl-carrier-protein] dehydratase
MNLQQDVSRALLGIEPDGPNAWQARFRFEPGQPVFQGHFPGHAIVPGVYLLECAACAFRKGSGLAAAWMRVKSAKFLALVEPPCEVVVKVKAVQKEGCWSIQAEMFRDAVLSASAFLEMN